MTVHTSLLDTAVPHTDIKATMMDAATKSFDTTVNDDGEASDKEPGMIADVKNLYQSKPDNRGKTTWVDKYPDDLEEAAENAQTARYALLIRFTKCYDGRKKLQVNSIIVQSPLLKKALRKILKDYPGITTSLDRLTFTAPFQPFVHRWSKLLEALASEQKTEPHAHLRLLYRILEEELRDDLKARDDFILNGVITYSTLWMIFEPGTVVLSVKNGQDCAAKFTSGNYQQTPCGECYALHCQIVDWDGERFGLGSESSKISRFEGTMEITKLSVFPLIYHPDLSGVKCDLISRGKVFEELSGYHYKAYQGVAIGQGPWGPIKYNVDSRIIIDTYGWNRFNPNRQVSLNALSKPKDKTVVTNVSDTEDDESEEEQADDEAYPNTDSSSEESFTYARKRWNPMPALNTDALDASALDAGASDAGASDAGGSDAGALDAGALDTDHLNPDELLICSATLKGYSLRNKKWLTFSIDSVKDIKYSEGAFESLVLPEDHKQLILALTESQVANKERFDDVIQGKGKGMIMLLSGPPGVGKTLTAESVAETMKVPLYLMSAGDLGLDSSEVESSLSNVLEMATKWNAIVLLDEADVFLEQRCSQDLERNKLVSIFLRILEYYEGILFLTTNRVENIDAAFQSRIHLSIHYNELDTSSRRHVWENLLTASKGKEHGFREHELDFLAGYKMNGREIKNVLKTAQLLASRQGSELEFSTVMVVLHIEKKQIET